MRESYRHSSVQVTVFHVFSFHPQAQLYNPHTPWEYWKPWKQPFSSRFRCRSALIRSVGSLGLRLKRLATNARRRSCDLVSSIFSSVLLFYNSKSRVQLRHLTLNIVFCTLKIVSKCRFVDKKHTFFSFFFKSALICSEHLCKNHTFLLFL